MKVAGLVQSSCWVGLFSFPAVSASCASREEPSIKLALETRQQKSFALKPDTSPLVASLYRLI